MSDETTVMAEALVPATSGSAGYEVEGEPGVYWCARHSKVKTRLRCGRCEKPICTKCTKYGPTGARCPECASFKGSHVYRVSPQNYLVAIVVAVMLGSVSGLIAQIGSFFALFYAPVAGTMIAKAISAVTKHKRGTSLAVIASAGLVFGAMIPLLGVPTVLFSVASSPSTANTAVLARIMMGNITNPIIWIYLGLSIPSVWYWLK